MTEWFKMRCILGNVCQHMHNIKFKRQGCVHSLFLLPLSGRKNKFMPAECHQGYKASDTWSAACDIRKQIDKRSFWAAKVVYMLVTPPHCGLHRKVSACLSQFWLNVFFKSLHWLPVCQKTDFKILFLVCKALKVLRTEHIWYTWGYLKCLFW